MIIKIIIFHNYNDSQEKSSSSPISVLDLSLIHIYLHHLAALGIATAEMLEFGADYAKQILVNSQELAQNLHELGFNVLCEDLGFTESHQVVMDV